MVEQLDVLFYREFSGVPRLQGAGLNTETPAWAVDRLSILSLKIYHMQIEADRKDSQSGFMQGEVGSPPGTA